MSHTPGNSENFPDSEASESLVAELKAIYGRDVAVPAALDAEILREARGGFARRRRFRLAVRAGFAAAAAAVALAFILPAVWNTDPAQPPRVPVAASQVLMVAPASTEDVDHSGEVNILDAFVVARLIEVRGELDEAYDVNGDGTVDQADVDRIAMVAVDTSRVDEARVQ